MKITYTIMLMALFSARAFCSDEAIIQECRSIITETCHEQSLENCEKKTNKSPHFETCLAVLMPFDNVPRAVNDLQSNRLFNSSSDACLSTINSQCGEEDVKVCMDKKAYNFDAECRELVTEIYAQREKMQQIPGGCYSSAYLSCEAARDISISSRSAFLASVELLQRCISGNVLQNAGCISPIQQIIDQKKTPLPEKHEKPAP